MFHLHQEQWVSLLGSLQSCWVAMLLEVLEQKKRWIATICVVCVNSCHDFYLVAVGPLLKSR